MLDAAAGAGLRLKSVGWRDTETPDEVMLSADVSASGRDDAHMEGAVRALGAEPTVRVARSSTKDDAAADWVGPGSV